MINPTYTYKTRHGEKVTFDTFDRAKLENYNISSREIPTVVHISFCGRRIDCLTSGLNISSIKTMFPTPVVIIVLVVSNMVLHY